MSTPSSQSGPAQQGQPPQLPPQRDGRSVAFYVAVFLSLLLVVSGALNVILLVVSVFNSVPSGLGTGVVEEDGSRYELIAVDGDRGASASVLRIPIDGAIAEAGSPLLGAVGGTVSQVRRALRAAVLEPTVKAVLVDINSPGGGVTDSDEIWRLIRGFRHENPDVEVVALMGDMATSGGYYIAAACDLIIARPTTITGSIGVIISSLNYGKTLEDWGIEAVTLTSKDTPYKDMLSPTRPMLDVEKEKVLAIVQEMYDRFVEVVHMGRPDMTVEQVRALATGEIYSGSQALNNGLVDQVGSLQDAYDEIADMLGEESFRVIEHRRIPGVFDALFAAEAEVPAMDAAVAQLLRSSTGPRFLYYWQGGR